MTIEEAKTCKQHLELLKAEIEWDKPIGYQMDLDLAIESIEKQIPKKPKKNLSVARYCPNCENGLRMFYERENKFQNGYERIRLRPPFCEDCGQAIDWKDEE